MSQERRENLAKEGTLVDGEPDGQEKGGQERGKREGTKPRPPKRLQCHPGIRTTSQAPALPAGDAPLRSQLQRPPSPAQRRLRPRQCPPPPPGSSSGSSASDPRSPEPAPASCSGERRSASQAAGFSSPERLRGPSGSGDRPSAGKSRPGPASGALGSARRAGARGRARPRPGWGGRGWVRVPAPPGTPGGCVRVWKGQRGRPAESRWRECGPGRGRA